MWLLLTRGAPCCSYRVDDVCVHARARVEVLILAVKGQGALVDAVQPPFNVVFHCQQAAPGGLGLLGDARQGEHGVTVDGLRALLGGYCKPLHLIIVKLL